MISCKNCDHIYCGTLYILGNLNVNLTIHVHWVDFKRAGNPKI
jgi:hypothetical protein